MNENKIQAVIRKLHQAGASLTYVDSVLSSHPYLMLRSEIDRALDEFNASRVPVKRLNSGETKIQEVSRASLLAQQGIPPERNHTPSKTNRSAVKEFALEVSRVKKQGKFERVGSEHLKWVEAELENFIQGICRNAHSEDDIETQYDFLNWKQVGPRVREVLNRAVRRAIFSRVKNHPSTGKTLK